MRLRSVNAGLFALGLAAMCIGPAAAQVVSGSNGSDGALIVGSNHVIDLGLAPTGPWDSPNPNPGQGRGMYDPDLWAVVFRYSTVNITASGVVSFQNHESGAPVVWLVDGDVTISGIVNLNGEGGLNSAAPFQFAQPGPGGFQGGSAFSGGFPASAGFGPGGGAPGAAGVGGVYQGEYGHAHNVAIIGGSGGGGNTTNSRSGGAGGGAILIVASGEINFLGSGQIRANGGAAITGSASGGGGGSGGAIRLIANTITGSGNVHLQANGGNGGNVGGPGRIRIEALETPAGMNSSPFYTFSGPGPIFPPSNAPMIRVVSIGGVPVPPDPAAGIDFTDVIIQNGQVEIQIEAVNVPAGTPVLVHLRKAHGAPVFVPAMTTLQPSGSVLTATAIVNLPDVPVEIQLIANW